MWLPSSFILTGWVPTIELSEEYCIRAALSYSWRNVSSQRCVEFVTHANRLSSAQNWREVLDKNSWRHLPTLTKTLLEVWIYRRLQAPNIFWWKGLTCYKLTYTCANKFKAWLHDILRVCFWAKPTLTTWPPVTANSAGFFPQNLNNNEWLTWTSQ